MTVGDGYRAYLESETILVLILLLMDDRRRLMKVKYINGKAWTVLILLLMDDRRRHQNQHRATVLLDDGPNPSSNG